MGRSTDHLTAGPIIAVNVLFNQPDCCKGLHSSQVQNGFEVSLYDAHRSWQQTLDR